MYKFLMDPSSFAERSIPHSIRYSRAYFPQAFESWLKRAVSNMIQIEMFVKEVTVSDYVLAQYYESRMPS